MATLNTAIRGAQIAASVCGDGLVKDVSDNIKVNVDGVTVEIGSGGTADMVQVKAGGIGVTHISSSIAGDGLTGGGGSALAVGAGNGISVSADAVTVLAGVGSGVANAADAILVGASGISVKIDDTTIGANLSDQLEVKDGAITEPKLAMNDSPNDGEVITWNSGGGYMEWTSKTETSAIVEADILYEDESANCNGATTNFSLAQTPVVNSVCVYLNGLLQQEGSGKDYTLSGTTISFAVAPLTGDLLLIHYIKSGA